MSSHFFELKIKPKYANKPLKCFIYSLNKSCLKVSLKSETYRINI